MSSRFLPAILVAIAIALVPTVLHSYLGVKVDDGRHTATISSYLDGFAGYPSDKDAGWGQRWLASHDWIERRYASGADQVLLTVVRSYDWKGLYHHPENAVARGVGFREAGVYPVGEPKLPMHVLRPERDGAPGAVYLLHYDETYVDDPIRFQLVKAAELLFRGPKPLTLAFARDLTTPLRGELEKLPSTRVLIAAMQQLLQPSSSTPGE